MDEYCPALSSHGRPSRTAADTAVVYPARNVEIPCVAVAVDRGETLHLMLTAVSDMGPGHSSVRTPGTVVLEDLSVGVPLTES